MLCLAFSEIQSRDFLAVSPIPGLRSGSNAKAFSILTYPGLSYRPLLSELCFARINDLHGKFADMIWLILAQTSLINEAPLRLKLRSVNLGVVDSLVPRLIYWRKRPACALCYQIKFLILITA